MATFIAALLFRPEDVSDRALSQGFGVALGGFDVPSPRLLVAEIPGLSGFSAAFYASAAKIPRGTEDEEFEHACELFEDELPPALAVLDAAIEMGRPNAVVYALTFAEDVLHDDAWRFDARGVERHFAHEGDEGIEVGFETPSAGEVKTISVPEEEEAAKVMPHRGTTFLSKELGVPIVGALVGALFAAEKRILVRLVEPDPASIEAEVMRLNKTLKRVAGRGSFEPPRSVGGAPVPAAYEAFVRAYDFNDPADPQDLYRELSIGAVEGTLRFFRRDDFNAIEKDQAFGNYRGKAGSAAVFPIARFLGSTLGAGAKGILGIADDGEHLRIVRPSGEVIEAGPTFGELIRYLALGWSSRTEAEEDMIGALMLRAKLRVDREIIS
ncbi:MAG: hypothetical protein HUU21_08445 [Polyangiaceae bacterium]|nr:hypothetical protein [Polyangiaceae bacterium]